MNLVESLQQIPDFRRKQGLRYPLLAVLLITIMSIMSGRCRYREIAAFAKANKKELLKFFHLKKRKRLPSHVTFREVLKGVNFDDVLKGLRNFYVKYRKLGQLVENFHILIIEQGQESIDKIRAIIDGSE